MAPARYLIQPPDPKRRRKPRKQELRSQAADRKTHLVQQERVGKYTEGEILKLFYDHIKQEEAPIVSKGMTKMNTDDFDNEVLSKVEAMDLDGAEAYLDATIAQLTDQLAKAKKHPPPPAPTTDDDELDELDDEEVKKFAADDVEDSIAKIQAMDYLDGEFERISEIAKIADAHNASPLRKRALAATLDAMEREVDRVAKLGGRGEYSPFNQQVVRYPHNQDSDVLQHHQVETHAVTQFPDRSQHTTLNAVVSPLPSQFEAKVQQIATERGLSRTAAQTRCRIENPSLYWAYVNGDAAEPTQAQQSRQRQYSVDKSAPTTSYEDLVQSEMAKGFTEQVAQTRIANWYGVLPGGESFAKQEDAYDALRECAQGLLDESDPTPRTTALRKARLENESLYKRLNAV